MAVKPAIPVCLELPRFSPESLSPDNPSVLGKPEKLHLLPGESQAKKTGFACLPLLPIHDLGAEELCYTSGTTSPPFLFKAFYFDAERWGGKKMRERTHDSYWSLLPPSFVVIAYLAEPELSQRLWWIEANALIGHRCEDTSSMGPLRHIIPSDGNSYSKSIMFLTTSSGTTEHLYVKIMNSNISFTCYTKVNSKWVVSLLRSWFKFFGTVTKSGIAGS